MKQLLVYADFHFLPTSQKLGVLLIAVPAGAQNPQQLGENHAHRRVQVNHRYLLLPVQEREDLATIDDYK
ncbi:MAG: hypothetical protein J6P56_00490 [Bacteroidales bacterium]|nr:hypothetical protein [Bacteroidales bacterium]